MGSVEQQIYASLADESLKAGHHTHAATPGLDAATIEAHEEVCNHWGQYEATSPFKRSLVHLPLYEGEGSEPSHHLVILITDQGRDAKGRPGAMLRHLVRLDAEAFAAFDFDPFHLWRQGLLLAKWTPQTPFPQIANASDRTSRGDLQSIFPERYPLLRGLLSHLLATGRLHLQSSEDSPAAEETLGQLVELLPPDRRARLALTTFAYANANEYQLAVVRRGETTLRSSLEKFLDEPADGLATEDRAYLDRLFAALAAKDWNAAAACVHGEPVRSAPPRPTTPSVPFTPRGSAGAEAASEGEDMGAWAPSFRRGAPERKQGTSKRAIWIVALLVVAVAVGAIAVLQRGAGSDGPAGGRVNTRVEAASDLNGLVEEHARRLDTLLDQGSRDFDLAEAMRGMHARLGETVQATVESERAALAEAARATGGDPTAMALLLRDTADRIQRASRRLAALEAVLADADAAKVRAAAEANPTRLDLGESEPEGPQATPVAHWAAQLAEASPLVRATETLSWPPAEEDWNAQAQGLAAVAPAAPALAELGDTVAGQAALIAALAKDAGSLGADLLPFERASLDAARTSAERAQRAWGGLPTPLRAMDRLLDLGARASARPRGAAASEWMFELGEATKEGGLLESAAAAGPARAWLARWRVEVRRGIQGELGAGAGTPIGFAAVNAAETARVADALDEFAQAPTPAPAALVEQTRQQQRQLQDPLHRALYADWLRRQEQGRARTGSAFEDVYGALQRARASFASAPSASTWSALRAALTATEQTGLDVVARDPARKAQVDAVRRFARGLSVPVAAQMGVVRVELLRRSDYSGTERSLAQLRAVLVRRSDDAVLWQAGAPPVLAPPGAAFQKVEIRGGTGFEIGATDGVSLLIRDEKTSLLWAHLWADAGARGHVLDALAGTHEVKLSEAQQRSLQEAAAPARPDGQGESIARITVEVDASFWPALAQALAELP